MLYDAGNDPELLAEMTAGATKCFELNSLPPTKAAERKALIRQLLGKTGENFEIRSPFQCDYGYNIEVGENFFMNFNCVILDGARVTFGDNVFVAPGCGFYTAGHPLDAETRNKGLASATTASSEPEASSPKTFLQEPSQPAIRAGCSE